jgi:hypothetical protein
MMLTVFKNLIVFALYVVYIWKLYYAYHSNYTFSITACSATLVFCVNTRNNYKTSNEIV